MQVALKPSDLPHRQDNGLAVAERALPGAPQVALLIDKQSLSRECVGALLATNLPEWAFQFAESIRDIPEIGESPGAFLVILHTHAASLSSPEVASEIHAITEATPEAHLVILSDIGEAAEVRIAMQLGARGYLPADLPFAQAAAAIRFVGDGGTLFQHAFWLLRQRPSGHYKLIRWTVRGTPFISHGVSFRYWRD